MNDGGFCIIGSCFFGLFLLSTYFDVIFLFSFYRKWSLKMIKSKNTNMIILNFSSKGKRKYIFSKARNKKEQN